MIVQVRKLMLGDVAGDQSRLGEIRQLPQPRLNAAWPDKQSRPQRRQIPRRRFQTATSHASSNNPHGQAGSRYRVRNRSACCSGPMFSFSGGLRIESVCDVHARFAQRRHFTLDERVGGARVFAGHVGDAQAHAATSDLAGLPVDSVRVDSLSNASIRVSSAMLDIAAAIQRFVERIARPPVQHCLDLAIGESQWLAAGMQPGGDEKAGNFRPIFQATVCWSQRPIPPETASPSTPPERSSAGANAPCAAGSHSARCVGGLSSMTLSVWPMAESFSADSTIASAQFSTYVSGSRAQAPVRIQIRPACIPSRAVKRLSFP